MIISTNIQAQTAQRFFNQAYNNSERSLEKLASGSRINCAADDASGLYLSDMLRANIRSGNQAIRDTQDGVSLAQTAEGALTEITSILIRLRELSTQAASDTVTDPDRSLINTEVQQLKSEVDRIANTTEFNGSKLLNGSRDDMEIQIGLGGSKSLDRIVFERNPLLQNTATLGIADIATDTRAISRENLAKIDSAVNHVAESRATLGAFQNRLEAIMNNMRIYTNNLDAAKSKIKDTDMADEQSTLTRSNIMLAANMSVLGQANTQPKQALGLLD